MFEIGAIYIIEKDRFRYNGKVRDLQRHQFVSVTDPEDVREISIFLGDYLKQIQRNKVG
jgi:hypothetical protein